MGTVGRRGPVALLLVLVLAASACADGGDPAGGDDAGATAEPREGPTITVASFNFAESLILAEIYAQALEADGFPVERKLDLGAREVIFPSLAGGELDFLPEYIGSSLAVGFEVEDAPADSEEGHERLTEEFAELGITVLDFAPGQDKNVYVVTPEFAEEHDLESISDLAEVEGGVTLGAPPECENRETCLVGLRDAYGLDDIDFEVIQESPARVAALDEGTIDVALLFSTQPVIKERGWIALEDDEGIIPAENIVPVVHDEIVEAYGDDFTELVDAITATITTDVLLELNGRVELEAEDPDDVAASYLEQEGFVS